MNTSMPQHFFRKNSKTNFSGFTLIETLVAISILAIVIAGSMAAIQVTLKSTVYAKDAVTAKFLAEEGIESIRNMRDTNIINGLPWMSGIADPDVSDGSAGSPCGDISAETSSSYCYIDSINNTVPMVCTGQDGTCTTPLNFDNDTKDYLYSDDSGNPTPSKFIRSIQVVGVDGINGSPDGTAADTFSARVTVTITWDENGDPQTYSVIDYLYPWYVSNDQG